MNGELTISWPGGEKSFAPGTAVKIGRDPACQVVVDNPNVSRHHATVTHDGAAWVFRDEGSFQGTFRGGQSLKELRLEGNQTVTLGAPQVGVELTLALGDVTTATRPRQSNDDEVDTVIPHQEPRPGGALREEVFDSATVVGGQTLRVECGGKTHQFSPGKTIKLGRDASADVVSTNPTVSRTHALISHDGEGWKIQDCNSSAGTFIEGRRIKTARLAGSTAVWLGDEDTGERVVVVASGEKAQTPISRVRRMGRSGYLGVGTAVVAVVAVAVSILSPGSGSTHGTLDRDQLARGVVRIETSEGSLGSGTVIDAQQGLILTSAHVVAPRALGQAITRDLFESELSASPRNITIWVSSGLDEIAEPRYQGQVVAEDGYLDLAIVKITRTSGGALVEPGDLDGLVEIPIGDASTVESGDPIQILGYPTVANSNAATLTTGVLAGAVQDTRLGSNRAFINLDAQIRPGNSGGLVADEAGRIIGVPTLNWIEDSQNIGAMRPITFAHLLIEAAQHGDPYESPYVAPLTGNEDFPVIRFAQGTESGFRTECSSPPGEAGIGSRRLTLHIGYEGFNQGEHQDVSITVVEEATGDIIGWASSSYDWPIRFNQSGCITVGMALTRPLVEGVYFIDVFLGPNNQYYPDLGVAFEL